MFRGKALGGWALSRLVVERGGLFVSFGSLNGQFGGVNVGAYAAANAFLEGLCNQLTQETGVSSYCLHWSLWDELGIGSTYTKKALSRARGYYALATADGFQSLQVALRYGLSQVLVGLDESRPWIRRAMGVEPYGERCGIVYLSGEGKPPHLTARDALGEPLRLEFTHIEQFPRTADGAIDREQLKLSAGAGLSRGRSLPRTQIEVTLARIYQRVLGISLVGVDDNFFELGGHSLLAVRLLAEIRNALHVELPLDSVIETPTIAGLARSLASRLEAGEAESPLPKYVVALRRGGSRRPFFCVHPASGTSIVFGQLAGFMNPDRPFYGFQCPGLTDDQPLLETVEQQAALYVAAMREVTPGPYLLGGWSAGGPVVFEMARMLEAQGQEVRFLALLDCGLLESDVPSGARRKLSPTATLKGTLMLLRFARWMGMPKSYADWRALAAMGGIALPVSMRDVTRRPVVEQLRFLRGLNAEILRFTRIFRINTKAGIDYKPQPYGGKVTVLRTAQRVDPDPILADLHKYAAEVDYLKIDGNHMSIIFDANDSRALAHRLDECMEGM
jgi:thioesterase domain-containing protein/acyl carrier protein